MLQLKIVAIVQLFGCSPKRISKNILAFHIMMEFKSDKIIIPVYTESNFSQIFGFKKLH